MSECLIKTGLDPKLKVAAVEHLLVELEMKLAAEGYEITCVFAAVQHPDTDGYYAEMNVTCDPEDKEEASEILSHIHLISGNERFIVEFQGTVFNVSLGSVVDAPVSGSETLH